MIWRVQPALLLALTHPTKGGQLGTSAPWDRALKTSSESHRKPAVRPPGAPSPEWDKTQSWGLPGAHVGGEGAWEGSPLTRRPPTSPQSWHSSSLLGWGDRRQWKVWGYLRSMLGVTTGC